MLPDNISVWVRARNAHPASRKGRTAKPQVEILEDRTAPSISPVPNAVEDNFVTARNTERTFDVFANDVFSNKLQITDFSSPENATLVDNGDGTFTFIPDADFVGSTSFEYTVEARNPEIKLVPDDIDVGDNVGFSVDIDGDTAVVGSAYDGPNKTGAAYVFVRDGDGWTQQAKLQASDGEEDDRFGNGVAIDGDTIVVGTPGKYPIDRPGTAYVFVREGTTWTEQDQLIPSGGEIGDFFGVIVDVDGDTAVVSSPFDSTEGTYAGAAYAFVRSGTTWTEEVNFADLVDNGEFDFLGGAVAVDGDTALVGADGDENYTGAVYAFVRSGTTWTLQDTLMADDASELDSFGRQLDLDGDVALIGAPSAYDPDGSGAAYIFRRNGEIWQQEQKLTPSDSSGGDGFGFEVAIDDGIALVSAGLFGPGGSAPDESFTYHFDMVDDEFVETKKFTARDTETGDFFGFGSAISGTTAILGSFRADTRDLEDSGAAYIFDLGPAETKLVPDDIDVGDNVGFSVDIDGDTAVVGSAYDGPNKTGAAYVFVRDGDGWTQQAKLQASDGEEDDRFGNGVAIDGDTIVVGTPGKYPIDRPGTAYVFVREGTTWTEQDQLIPSGGEIGDFFGVIVDVDGDTAVVSSPFDSTEGTYAGAAYAFVRSGTTWTEEVNFADLVDNGEFDFLGGAVAVDGDTALVGADGDENYTGAVYAFVRSGTTWTLQDTLMADDASELDSFGRQLDLDGDVALIGAPSAYDPDGSGAAYIFRRNGEIWQQEQKLTPSDSSGGDGFGFEVAIDDGIALVSAGLFGPGGSAPDESFTYRFDMVDDEFVETNKFTARDTEMGDFFGFGSAISGTTAIIGSFRADTLNLEDSGAAYIFELGKDTATVEVSVGEAVIMDGNLVVGGSSGNDAVVVQVGARGPQVRIGNRPVEILGEGSVERIVVNTFAGNDSVQIQGQVDAEIYGGDGNDQLRGGQGNNVIFGGAGNDFLYGFSGDDLLVGGGGLDFIYGVGGANILVGGELMGSFTFEQLRQFVDDWKTSGELASAFLSAVVDPSTERDFLLGGGGADALVAGAFDLVYFFPTQGDKKFMV